MADEKTQPGDTGNTNERRKEADEAALTPGPSDKQGDTRKPDPVEQQPT